MTLIRPANRQYIQLLAAQFNRDADWARYVTKRLKHRNTLELVAEKNGQLIGFILVRVVQRGGKEPNGRLLTWLRHWCRLSPSPDTILQPIQLGLVEELCLVPVKDDEVAAELMQQATAWLASQMITECRVTVPMHDNISQQKYRQLGFTPAQFSVRKYV